MNNPFEIKPAVFKEILNYIYSGNINNWSLSQDILLAANFLQISDLKSECVNYLKSNLTTNTVSSVLKLAQKCNIKSLKLCCTSYIYENVNLIGKSDNFQCLKEESFLTYKLLDAILRMCAEGKMLIADNIKPSSEKSTTDVTCCNTVNNYESFLNNESLSDVKIRVGNKIYHSHKLVLSASCPVINRMLMSNMQEGLNNLIEIKDMKEAVFDEILR